MAHATVRTVQLGTVCGMHEFMPLKPFIVIHVAAERTADEPRPWSWTIRDGRSQQLIARSRAEFANEAAALFAGHLAGGAVRRNLERLEARKLTRQTPDAVR